jgi:hypothetical protein
MAAQLVCPSCKGDNVYPARTRGLDRLVMLIGARPYWCSECGERFRSTATPESGPGADLNPSEEVPSVCPNCTSETMIQLTAGERELAVQDGWVVSCPNCRALYPFIRPTH